MPTPARGLFAFEFNRSKKSGVEGYRSPLGELFETVNIAGAVTSVEISPVSGKVYARVSDPTGVFMIDAGKKKSSPGHFFTGVTIPSFVSVTGVAEYTDGMRIIAEAAIGIDRGMRNSWIGSVSRRTIERLEAAAGKNHGGESGDLCLYADLIERALEVAVVTCGRRDADSGKPDYSEKVLELIELHSGEKGLMIEELFNICKSLQITENDVRAAIESLVEEGECYLPAGGFIRRI